MCIYIHIYLYVAPNPRQNLNNDLPARGCTRRLFVRSNILELKGAVIFFK